MAHAREHHEVPVLKESSLWLPEDHPWRRWPAIGTILAVVGLGGSLGIGLSGGFAGGEAARHQLWHSWLVGALFVLSLALGALFFVLVHHATQAGWSVVVRRLAENAMSTIPWIGLLFVPLLFGMGELFHWSHADAVAADHLLAHKQPYLNVPFFLVRTALYFAVWSGIALWFSRLSRRQDGDGDPEITRRMRRASAPSLILFALTVTFASFDWLMSLQPHWYSTIFGVYFFAGSMVGFFAFLALLALNARSTGLLVELISFEHQHDIGKLLFAFVAFWAYIGFSQFFLIWYGNIPEETAFFATRLTGSWRPASFLLAVGHFIVPFFFLLPRTIKRNSRALAAAAVWLLVMHLLDLHWLVMPNIHPEGMAPSLLDLAALIGSVGVFLAAFGRALRRHPLVPLRDPRLPESLLFENP
jgi:hypothetical protein